MTEKPTHDHESEHLVISYLLTADDRTGADEVLDGLGEQDFTNAVVRDIFRGVSWVAREGVAITTATVAQALHELGIRGSHAHLLKLTMDHPSSRESAISARAYMRELSRWRLLLDIANGVKATWQKGGATVDGAIAQALADFDGLSRGGGASVRVLGDVMRERVAMLKANEGKPVRRMLTGYKILDDLTGGLGDSDLVVLAAPTGGGKSAFAAQVFASVAGTGRNVLVASAEMQAWELGDRLLSSCTYVPAHAIRDNRLDREQLKNLELAAGYEPFARVHVLERHGALTVERIGQVARHLQRRDGLALVVVDYLQLISSITASGDRGRTREAEVAAVTRGLKNLAMDLSVPVLALSQFNREANKQGGEPELHHLRESGEIEQAANIVLFLWHDDAEAEDVHRLAVKKHRSGPANLSIKLRWSKKTLTFERAL